MLQSAILLIIEGNNWKEYYDDDGKTCIKGMA
jgi:hypothetical protein